MVTIAVQLFASEVHGNTADAVYLVYRQLPEHADELVMRYEAMVSFLCGHDQT